MKEPLSPTKTSPSKKRQKRQKAVIADLPRGVHVYKEAGAYRVRLNKGFTGGATQRRRFDTIKDAREWIHGPATALKAVLPPLTSIKSESGTDAFSNTPKEMLEAAAAIKKLGGVASVSQAIEYFLKHAQPATTLTVEAAIKEIHADRKTALGDKNRHTRELRAKLTRFLKKHLHKKLTAITVQDLRDALAEDDATGYPPSASQKVKRLRYWSALAEFARRNQWLVIDPGEAITRPKIVKGRPAILTPEEIKRLLIVALRQFPQYLPALVLKIYGGLRNEELYLARWEDIKETAIRVQITKTGCARSVTIEPALLNWLSLPKDRPKEGLIMAEKPAVKDREAVWFECIKKIENLAEVTIQQNALRHSFGSYHYQKYKDITRTANEMGNLASTCSHYYVDYVTDQDADAFWNIQNPERPEPKKEKQHNKKTNQQKNKQNQ